MDSLGQPIVIAVVAVVVTWLTAVQSGLREVTLAYLKRWKVRIEATEGKRAHIDGIRRIKEFKLTLDQLENLSFVTRVLLFVGSNCGGTPTPGKPYTVKCIDGWSHRKGEHPEQMYDFALRVDAAYADTLLRLIAEGIVVNETDRMPEKSQLRRFYETEKVLHSVLLPIDLTATDFLFISLAKYDEPAFTEPQVAQITLIIQRLRSIFIVTDY